MSGDTPRDPHPTNAPYVPGESGEVLFGLLRPSLTQGASSCPQTDFGAHDPNKIGLGSLYSEFRTQDFKRDYLLIGFSMLLCLTSLVACLIHDWVSLLTRASWCWLP